jgi:hypothetical protein
MKVIWRDETTCKDKEQNNWFVHYESGFSASLSGQSRKHKTLLEILGLIDRLI